MAHPLDIDLLEMAQHLSQCELCRLKFARIMYDPDGEPLSEEAALKKEQEEAKELIQKTFGIIFMYWLRRDITDE